MCGMIYHVTSGLLSLSYDLHVQGDNEKWQEKKTKTKEYVSSLTYVIKNVNGYHCGPSLKMVDFCSFIV